MNKITRRICITGMMASLAFVLDIVSPTDGFIKIPLYAFPLLLTGILFDYKYGLLAGLVEGFLMQLTYGLSLTSILWMLAPISWGLVSGLIYPMLKKQNIYIRTIITVLLSSLFATLFNTIAMYISESILGNPIEYIIIKLYTRLSISILTTCIYSFILIILVPKLSKITKK